MYQKESGGRGKRMYAGGKRRRCEEDALRDALNCNELLTFYLPRPIRDMSLSASLWYWLRGDQ